MTRVARESERGWLPRDTGWQTDRQTDRQEKLDSWGHSLPRLSGPLSLPLHPLLPAELMVSAPDVASGFLSVHWSPVGQ